MMIGYDKPKGKESRRRKEEEIKRTDGKIFIGFE
jgi:hypothetical protein